ncbi:hypothetical protein MVEN_00105000 [Mycena venus]|uniref:Uncharacterized protein n=1 Tax=Mycena venus TaxID=2733690 RepID=A0A8H6Z7S0_9AGAR|nr:hypothetical protein MVEN_00105000 [Mycena venus]
MAHRMIILALGFTQHAPTVWSMNRRSNLKVRTIIQLVGPHFNTDSASAPAIPSEAHGRVNQFMPPPVSQHSVLDLNSISFLLRDQALDNGIDWSGNSNADWQTELHPHFFDEFLADLNSDPHSTMFGDSALTEYGNYSADGGVPDAGAASGDRK